MSARSLNKVFLIGNLTRDPDVRYTAQGTAVATFGVATNREWTGPDGQKHEDVTFHRIVAWGKLAEICEKLLFKGRKVFVEGRLQNRKWTGSDGQERETVEIVADNMVILDNRRRDNEDVVLGDDIVVKTVGTEEEKSETQEAKEKKTQSTQGEKSSKNGEKDQAKKTDNEETKKDNGEEVVEIDEIPF